MKVVRYIDDRGRMVAKVVPDETAITVPQDVEPLLEPKVEPQEEAPVLKKGKKGGKR